MNLLNIGIIVQVRFDSSRFPGKAAATLWRQESTISFLLKRLSRLNQQPNQTLVVATADTVDCDYFEKLCQEIDIIIFRGNKENVFSRFLECASKFSFDVIVRITGDCVLHCPQLVQSFIDTWCSVNQFSREDFILTNKYPFSFCDGFDVEVFSMELMRKNFNAIFDSSHFQEHVTTFFYENPGIKKINILNQKPLHFPTVRLVLDYPEDLKALKEIVICYVKSFPKNSPLEKMTYTEIASLDLFQNWSENPNLAPNFAYLAQNSTLFV